MRTREEWVADFYKTCPDWSILTDAITKIEIDLTDPTSFETVKRKVSQYRPSTFEDKVALMKQIENIILPYISGYVSGPVDQVEIDDKLVTVEVVSRRTSSLEEVAEFMQDNLDNDNFYLYTINKTTVFDVSGKFKSCFLVRFAQVSKKVEIIKPECNCVCNCK